MYKFLRYKLSEQCIYSNQKSHKTTASNNFVAIKICQTVYQPKIPLMLYQLSLNCRYPFLHLLILFLHVLYLFLQRLILLPHFRPHLLIFFLHFLKNLSWGMRAAALSISSSLTSARSSMSARSLSSASFSSVASLLKSLPDTEAPENFMIMHKIKLYRN